MGASESVLLAEQETRQTMEKEATAREKERSKQVEDTNKGKELDIKKENIAKETMAETTKQKGLDIEKEKITKERMVELAKLDIQKDDMLKKFELEILCKKQEYDKHTQGNLMAILSKMVEKGYDMVDMQYALAGITKMFANDKSIENGKFMDDLVRHKLALQGQALPAPSSSALATQVGSDQPENQDQENIEPEVE